ncbi:hypothetical protein LBMAG52_20690 [Planctomycetia bacterium]|nr:hypothetical protein LBMAG52_20690 [Planctomycetia bacterium]
MTFHVAAAPSNPITATKIANCRMSFSEPKRVRNEALNREASYRGRGRLATWAKLSETVFSTDEVDAFIRRNALTSGSNRGYRPSANLIHRAVPRRHRRCGDFENYWLSVCVA